MTVRALHRLLLKYLVLRCKFQAAAVTVAEAPVDSNYSEAVIWTVIQRQPEIHWPVKVAGAEAAVTAWQTQKPQCGSATNHDHVADHGLQI